MAVRLPDASSLGRRPVPQGSRSIAQQDTESAGRALAGLGATIGSAVGGAIEQYQKEDDAQAVFGARRKLDEWERAAIYDPEKGAVSKSGQAAFTLPDELAKSYDEFAGKVAGELKTERQRRAFSEVSMSRRSQVLDWASKHSAREREVYAETEHQANVESFLNRASRIASLKIDGTPEAAADRDKKIAAEIASGQGLIVGRMREKGMPGEAIAVATQDFASKAHLGVMAQLLAAGDPKSAEKYLSANEKAIDPDGVAKIRTALRDSVSLGDAQAAADEVMARGLTGQAALDEVRTRFKDNPTTRQRAESEVKTRLAEQEALKTREAKDTARQAWSIVVERGTLSAIPRDTMAKLNALAPEEERQMRDWLEAKARQAKSQAEGRGNDVTPDRLRRYIELRDKAREDPAAFLEVDLVKEAPYMTTQHWNTLAALRDSINKNDAKTMSALQVANKALKLQTLQQDLALAGVNLSEKKDKKKMEVADQFKRRFMEELDTATADGKVDVDGAVKIARNLLRVGVVRGSGWVWDDEKRAFQVSPEEMRDDKGRPRFVTKYEDIPAAVRQEILDDLYPGQYKAAAGVPTAVREHAERAYARGQMAGVK